MKSFLGSFALSTSSTIPSDKYAIHTQATHIGPAFNCALYKSTCESTSNYEAYGDCDYAVANNNASLFTCRREHLVLAQSDATVHCPHAAPNAQGPCAGDALDLGERTTTITPYLVHFH